MNFRENIKDIAKQEGLKVDDLLAMSPKRDPFFVGTPADIRDGEWFKAMWDEYGRAGLHLRGFHYALEVRKDIQLPRIVTWSATKTLPAGESNIYINNKHIWAYLQEASRCARWLKMVGFHEIQDKNTPPLRLIHDADSPGSDFRVDYGDDEFYLRMDADLPELIAEHDPELTEDTNVYLMEVWAEKQSIESELLPICQRYNANLLVSATGHMTATACHRLVERTRRAERPARIFYISDFDKSGCEMPIAAARKLEWFARDDEGLDIKLTPLALTREQAARFPQNPEEPGVEIDAMLALAPGELGRLLEDRLSVYAQCNVKKWVGERFKGLEDNLLADQRDALGPGLLKRMAEFNERVESLRQDLGVEAEEIQKEHDELSKEVIAITDEVNNDTDPDDYLEGFDAQLESSSLDNEGVWLYDSYRDYFDQIDAYKMMNEWRATI